MIYFKKYLTWGEMIVVMRQFFNGMKINGLVKRSCLLKHSHGECVIGESYWIFYEGFMWTGQRVVISSLIYKSIVFNFLQNGNEFYEI